MKNRAQNIIEFTFVFIVVMSIFLSMIELALYWRARYSVDNIANELIANIQITAQNTTSYDEIVNKAILTVKSRAGLLNLSDSDFVKSGSDGSYTIASSFMKHSKPALMVFINLNNLSKNDVSVGVAYTYTGIFLYQQGRAVSSGAAQSIQKF